MRVEGSTIKKGHACSRERASRSLDHRLLPCIALYRNGDVYTGSWVRGLQEGKGVLMAKKGHTYDGEWVGGKRHGKGILRCATI